MGDEEEVIFFYRKLTEKNREKLSGYKDLNITDYTKPIYKYLSNTHIQKKREQT